VQIHKLEDLIAQLEATIPFYETTNPAISAGSVGWHIEHTLLTLNGIANVLIHSDPTKYKWRFKWGRILIFSFKKIQRGRAKSPEVVMPKGHIDQAKLETLLSDTRTKCNQLAFLPANKFFEHPYLGKLKLKQTISFLEIHTNHHLEIIQDIVSN
jgi:hypothetical protein